MARERVTELGAVLTGAAPESFRPAGGHLFDSTGLAIRDLALCLALVEAHGAGHVKPATVRL